MTAPNMDNVCKKCDHFASPLIAKQYLTAKMHFTEHSSPTHDTIPKRHHSCRGPWMWMSTFELVWLVTVTQRASCPIFGRCTNINTLTHLNAFKELATPYRLFHHRLLITVVILTNRSSGYWIQIAHLRKYTHKHETHSYLRAVILISCLSGSGLLLLLLLCWCDTNIAPWWLVCFYKIITHH